MLDQSSAVLEKWSARTELDEQETKPAGMYCPDLKHPDVVYPIESALASQSTLTIDIIGNKEPPQGGPNWGALLAAYIHNHLPTTLIHVPTMQLVGRGAVQERTQAEIAQRASKELARRSHLTAPKDWKTLLERHARSVLGYAIMSHRWLDKGEPTFHDVMRYTDWDALAASDVDEPGLRKLHAFCEWARLHGCEWAWADTCCIDKTSSADLDESIRSMYRWYSNAAVALVYLAGTLVPADLARDPWFTRGWTLQELLAPRRLKFFNRHWRPLTAARNDKDPEGGLLDAISGITGISTNTLRSFRPGTDMIKEKMCWAARRMTTRAEDGAYALIGIFDVTLMTAYGEGARAFARLQMAIMEKTSAVELLVWCGESSADNSMLAEAPECFARLPEPDGPWWKRESDRRELWQKDRQKFQDAHMLKRLDDTLLRGGRSFELTNGGLRIDVVLYDVVCSASSTIPESHITVDLSMQTPPVIHVNPDPLYIEIHGEESAAVLAVLDYRLDDEDEHMLAKFVEKSIVTQVNMDRVYTAVILRYDPVTARYQRIFTEQIISIKRPRDSWRHPQTVYIT